MQCKVQELNTEYEQRRQRSFKVTVDSVYDCEMRLPDRWPIGVIVRRWWDAAPTKTHTKATPTTNATESDSKRTANLAGTVKTSVKRHVVGTDLMGTATATTPIPSKQLEIGTSLGANTSTQLVVVNDGNEVREEGGVRQHEETQEDNDGGMSSDTGDDGNETIIANQKQVAELVANGYIKV